MKKRIFILILAVACLIFALSACSNEEEHNHDHSTNTTQSTQKPGGTVGGGTVIECENHYWYNVTLDTKTESTNTAIMKGNCYLCGDILSKEVITGIDHDDWKNALLPEAFNVFTLVNGVTYTTYGEDGAMSWRIVNNVYSEEYFVNYPEKSGLVYGKNLEGYSLMHTEFTYNESTKTYFYEIDENRRIEMGFADKKLFSLSTHTNENGEWKKATTQYLNYGIDMTAVPDYFFAQYEKITSIEAISKSSVSQSDAQKISEFLSSLSFDLKHEISYLENGGLSVYFYIENGLNDPIFGGNYSSVSIVALDDKITSLTVGNNTIEFTY